MAFTDLNEENGWVKEQALTDVLALEGQTSAVEQVARKVSMTSRFASVPRFASNGVDVVAEGATIPLQDADLDEVTLEAVKFANRFAISYEDNQDSIVDVLDAYKKNWISNFHIKLDNACLGTTGAQNGGTVPFDSVYHFVGAGNRTATAGNLEYEDLSDVIGDMEGSRNGGLVVIAHPSFKMSLRNLKDADGLRVLNPGDALSAGVPTLFGHTVVFSEGARTSATATDEPAGNPLLIVAAKSNLILGVRSGPESQVSDQEQWANDNIELKMRARRGFVLAKADAARVIELTAAA